LIAFNSASSAAALSLVASVANANLMHVVMGFSSIVIPFTTGSAPNEPRESERTRRGGGGLEQLSLGDTLLFVGFRFHAEVVLHDNGGGVCVALDLRIADQPIQLLFAHVANASVFDTVL
jgi:hypothetical protein